MDGEETIEHLQLRKHWQLSGSRCYRHETETWYCTANREWALRWM